MLDMEYNATQTIAERVRQLRSLMLLHSYLYYHLDLPVVTDNQWQAWANELRDIQAAFDCEIGWYDAEFADWNGSTGYHLPVDGFVLTIAVRLGLKH